jgi:hypothetical protein
MSDLNRMRKLAGILTEGVMAVPGVGSESEMQTTGNAARGSNYAAFDAAQPGIDEMFDNMDEKAPPGMEDMVMDLKKEYPGEPSKAFATAWSIYNKKHGKTEEADVGMEEDAPSGLDDSVVQQAVARVKEMMGSFVSPMKATDTLIDELTADGHDDDTIAQIIDAVEQAISNDDSSDDEGGICPTCNGSGEGQYDGSSCHACGGSGEEKGERDSDDFNEPDDYDDRDSFYGGLEEEVPMQSKLDDALDVLIQTMQSGAQDAESEAQWVAKTHNVDPRELAHAYAQYKAEELGRSGMMEEVEDDKEEVEEAFDLNNGYDDIKFMAPGDFFPDGADGPVTSATGPSGARMGDNDEQKKTAVAETHKELVYNYRKFLKESAKK